MNTYSQSLRKEPIEEARRLVELTFETLLDGIAAEDRDLNAWESKCLTAALMMMADDDYDSAAAAMDACKLYPRGCPGRSSELMIQDMRALYIMLKDWPPTICSSKPDVGTA